MRFGSDFQIYDIGGEEGRMLQVAIEDLVLRGRIGEYCRHVFELWCEANGMDDRQGLLCMSTTFPQWALLSLLRNRVIEVEDANS